MLRTVVLFPTAVPYGLFPGALLITYSTYGPVSLLLRWSLPPRALSCLSPHHFPIPHSPSSLPCHCFAHCLPAYQPAYLPSCLPAYLPVHLPAWLAQPCHHDSTPAAKRPPGDHSVARRCYRPSYLSHRTTEASALSSTTTATTTCLQRPMRRYLGAESLRHRPDAVTHAHDRLLGRHAFSRR